jgi:NAD(P)-dependent dehydrogenase (short-subunit alcohol dehydrogenase family)
MIRMDLDLKGKRALVTGSTRGIGFATAAGLAEMGATVVMNGRTNESTEAGLSKAKAETPDARFATAPGDLSTAEGTAAVIAAAGDLDILVNNMSIYDVKAFEDISDSDWQTFLDTNLMSGLRLTRHYLPRMLTKNWGRVVFVSSESGINIPEEMIHYGVTKAAQLAAARGCAELTKGTGVTVNSVLPGPTWVEGLAAKFKARANAQKTTVEALQEQMFARRRPTSLLQRFESPQEIANMICYVCSPAASATNGAALRCDGGIVRNPF